MEENQNGVDRFSVSLPVQLLKELDRMIREKGYDNRSLALADMIRRELVEHRQHDASREIVGVITVVYDHHRYNVQSTLTDAQHDYLHEAVSTLHVHLDYDNCLEVIVLRGKAAHIRKLADSLIAAKGVKHGKLTVTSIGADLTL